MTFRDYMEQVERDARKAIEEGAGWCDTWDDMYGALEEIHDRTRRAFAA